MPAQTIPTALQADVGQVVINALKRPGPGNELGVFQSILGLLASRGRIRFRRNAPNGKAAKLVFEHSDSGTAAYYDLDDTPVDAASGAAKTADIGHAFIRDVLRVRNYDMSAYKGDANLESTSLWTGSIQKALKQLIELMETKTHTGTGAGNDPLGLPYWVNDSSVIGNVDQATDTWAQSTVIDASSASLALKFLREAVETSGDDDGATTDVIVSSKRQLNKYKELMGAKLQLTTIMIGDLEVTATDYDGIPWIAIQKFPKDVIYGLSLDSWWFDILLQDPDGEEVPPQMEGLDQAGIPFAFRHLAPVADDQRAAITNYHQLVCEEPFKQWKIENLSTTLA